MNSLAISCAAHEAVKVIHPSTYYFHKNICFAAYGIPMPFIRF